MKKILFDTSVLIAAFLEPHPLHLRAFPYRPRSHTARYRSRPHGGGPSRGRGFSCAGADRDRGSKREVAFLREESLEGQLGHAD
jgi:hypothetical protein